MHTAIAITLLFAAATAALGVQRAAANFVLRASLLSFLPLLVQAGMTVWFGCAGLLATGPRVTPVQEFTDQQFAAIGRVVIETARLEAVVREAIWHALGLDAGQGRLVTACMARPEQLHALRALGGRFFEWHELDEFIRLVAIIDAILLERDFILRAQWGFLMKDVIAVAATWLDNDAGEHTLTRSFPFPRIETLARESREYGAELKTWMARFRKPVAVTPRNRERKNARAK